MYNICTSTRNKYKYSRVCVCVPAGGLVRGPGKLTLSVDAVVFVVVRTGNVESAGFPLPHVVVFLCFVHKHIHESFMSQCGQSV